MDKISKLRKFFQEHNIDAYLVPSSDEFQNEYVPKHKSRLKCLTGFTGSNGLALITRDKKIFFTDGRYLLQAKNELDADFEVIEYTQSNLKKVLNDNPLIIGFDPKLHTINQVERFSSLSTKCKFVAIEKNLVDLVSNADVDSPKATSNIFIHNIKYTGQDTEYKRKYLKQDNVDALIITAPDSICWLLNLRGNAVEFTPFFLGFLIAYKDGNIDLFLEYIPGQEIITYLKKYLVKVKPISDVPVELKKLANLKVQTSPSSPYWFKQLVPHVSLAADPCQLPKAIKNTEEINGAIEAHLCDGAALTEFLCWLEQSDNETELSVSEKLLEYRKQQLDFVYPSFTTIAGFAENGAIIHYQPTPKTNKTIAGNNLLLLDSGGQYYGGTTDVTRVIAIGEPTAEQIHNFTLVLKGHIALSSAKFVIGTNGAQLDVLARLPLWKESKDYAHGTGHGVGSFLSVHEGPQRISKFGEADLQEGMIVSIEPGYYKENAYGIRIENLVLVKKSSPGFLCFTPLTKVFLEPKLIDFENLTIPERQWLKDYHQDIVEAIGSRLTPSTKIWLDNKIKPFA
jgi:Xaa-Pro aminopeptidase